MKSSAHTQPIHDAGHNASTKIQAYIGNYDEAAATVIREAGHHEGACLHITQGTKGERSK